MTDIYVGQRRSYVGCLFVVLLVVAVGAGLVYWRWLRVPSAPVEPAAPGAAEAPAQPAAPASDPGAQLLAEARQLVRDGQLLEARDKAYEVLDQSGDAPARRGAEDLLGEVNVELVLSPRAMPEKTEYTVAPGDSLALLAKRFNTTIDVIRKGNRISGSVIRVGDRFRIFGGQFSMKIDKSDNVLVVYLNERFFKRYPVGTGEFGRTPVGDFKINEKIPQPTWWRPDGKAIPYGDTNNVLGTHWLSLDIPGYGIHGTWEPETIGKQASAGCIRLLNEDIQELFTLVPEGTPVTITD